MGATDGNVDWKGWWKWGKLGWNRSLTRFLPRGSRRRKMLIGGARRAGRSGGLSVWDASWRCYLASLSCSRLSSGCRRSSGAVPAAAGQILMGSTEVRQFGALIFFTFGLTLVFGQGSDYGCHILCVRGSWCGVSFILISSSCAPPCASAFCFPVYFRWFRTFFHIKRIRCSFSYLFIKLSCGRRIRLAG